MNPGRGSTRLGNDAIPVWVDVPRWLAPKLGEAFRTAGIAFAVHEGFIEMRRHPADDESIHFVDRFTFPRAADDTTRGRARRQAAALIQRVVDSVPESRCPPRTDD